MVYARSEREREKKNLFLDFQKGKLQIFFCHLGFQVSVIIANWDFWLSTESETFPINQRWQ